jgi:hypothetical protein
MIYPVEEFLDVHINDPVVSAFYIPTCRSDRRVSSSTGSKPIAGLRECGVKDGCEYLQEGLLDQAVQNGGYS